MNIERYEQNLIINESVSVTLDEANCFKPTQPFWDLWRECKWDLKRNGIFISKNEGGYIGEYAPENDFAKRLSETEVHQRWIAEAEDIAEQVALIPSPKLPWHFDFDTLPESALPNCQNRCSLRVTATPTADGNYQLRLLAPCCERRGAQIKWFTLGQELVTQAIAYTLRQESEQRYVESLKAADQKRFEEEWAELEAASDEEVDNV